MTLKRSLLMFSIIAAGVAISGVALAGFGRSGFRDRMKDPQKISRVMQVRVDNVMDDLDATPSQRAKAKELAQRLLQDGLQLKNGHEAVREELKAQWSSNAPDKARVYALVDQRADEFKSFAKKAVDAAFELHQTLTPAQRAELSQELENGFFHPGWHHP